MKWVLIKMEVIELQSHGCGGTKEVVNFTRQPKLLPLGQGVQQ